MTAWVLVVLAANTVDGGLVVSDVEDVLQLNAATLAPCFASKKSAPAKVQFEVDAAGHVAGVTTSSACVRSALESVSFPTMTDAGSFVTWTVTKPNPRDGGTDVELLEGDALAPFDAEVTACYVAAGPTEKLEGSVSLEATALRSGAVRDVVIAEQSNAFAKAPLSARCGAGATRSVRLDLRDQRASSQKHLRAVGATQRDPRERTAEAS